MSEGLEIKNDIFYVLVTDNEKTIFLEKEDAAKELNKAVAEDKNLDVEKISILAANVSDPKKWVIQEVGWKEITIALMRGT